MSNEITTTNNLTTQLAWADQLAKSDLLPEPFRKRPADLIWALQFAEMLDLPAMAVITGIHVIKGKPVVSASLAVAMARRAGHKVSTKMTENGTTATTTITRWDDPEHPASSVWTLARAEKAGLLRNNPVWGSHPEAMLVARSQAEAVRRACGEVLHGLREEGGEPNGHSETVPPAQIGFDDTPVAPFVDSVLMPQPAEAPAISPPAPVAQASRAAPAIAPAPVTASPLRRAPDPLVPLTKGPPAAATADATQKAPAPPASPQSPADEDI